MSKYTTEVRFICESKCGLENSYGADNIDDVIANSWDKIFTSKAPFFDENYRSVLCQKILKHYYLREICCETVGIWKLWLNERLETIMPYYNQLYESVLIKFDPLNDVNITRKQDRTIDGTEERNGESSDTTNGTRDITNNGTGDITSSETKDVTNGGTRKVVGTDTNNETGTNDTTTSSISNENKKDLYSDTPQGAITSLENETYLTNARKIINNVTNSGSENTDTTRNTDDNYTENDTTNNTENMETNNTENTVTKNTENMTSSDTKIGTNKTSGSSNTTEAYLETLVGKQSGSSYSKMLMEFRDTFLNIDMLVIDQFKDLFFGLW